MRILEHVVTRDQENRTVKSIALKEMRLSRGQFSSLKFSGGITVDECAAWCRANRNELLSRIGRRVPRVYLQGGAVRAIAGPGDPLG